MSGESGARVALGAVRRTSLHLPPVGPERAATLGQLRAMFAGDLVATLDRLIEAGWSSDAAADAAGSYAAWAHGWLAEAIGEGFDRWERAR